MLTLARMRILTLMMTMLMKMMVLVIMMKTGRPHPQQNHTKLAHVGRNGR